MKNQLRSLNEPIKEFITIEKKVYDCMQMELLFLRNETSVEMLLEKVKKEEGFIFFFKFLHPKGDVGFITSKNLEERINKFIEFFNKYEKLPNFIKYLINKL